MMKAILSYLVLSVMLLSITHAKHVLFLTGKVTHGWGQHERLATSTLLAGLLKNVDPQITTEVVLVDDDGWPSQAQIDKADCIFLNTYGLSGHIVSSGERMAALERHMDQGKGLCAISFGLAVKSSQELGERWKRLTGGVWGANGVALFYTEKLFVPKGEDHPVVNGVPEHKINDEIFFNFERAGEVHGKLTPVLVHNGQGINFPSNAGIRGNRNAFGRKKAGYEFMMAWAFERAGGGRSFCHGGGRYHFNLAKDSYRKSLINGIMWTLGKDIPKNGYHSLTPSAVTMVANLDKVNKTSWNNASGLADLQRALNFNNQNGEAADWRNDETKSGIRLEKMPKNIPDSFSNASPSPEFNLGESS
ncbi:MAG: ThuA domain-containing protein [Akkermansiaceae bacterium]